MASTEQAFQIEQELKKNENLKREDLEIVRKWVKENYSYSIKPTDFELFLFLHSCYYNLEMAKKTAISYYQLRSDWPEVMKNRNPTRSPNKEQMNVSVVWKLKEKTEEGNHILFAKLMDFDFNNYDYEGQLKIFFAVCDFLLSQLGSCNGFVALFDAAGMSWGHVTKFNIHTMKTFVTYVQEAFPIRLKEVHIINSNVIAEKLYQMGRIFMNKELYSLVHLHSNLDSLQKYVPRRCLPKDYGGDDVSFTDLHGEMLEVLNKNADFFAKDDQEDVPQTASRFTYLNID